MARLSLAQVFGVGASQDADKVVIQKAALTGLTPSPGNRAEQLLSAILLTLASQIRGRLEEEGGQTITSETGEPISFDNSLDYQIDCYRFGSSLISRGGSQFLQSCLTFHAWVAPTGIVQTLTPSDFD